MFHYISVFYFKVIFWVFSFNDYFFVLGVMLGRHLVSNMNLGPEANPAEHLWFKAHFAGHVKDQRDIPLGSLKWLCLWREREMQRKACRRRFVYRPIIFSLPHAENAPKCGGARSQSSIPWTEGTEQQPVWSAGGVVGYRSNKELAGSS